MSQRKLAIVIIVFWVAVALLGLYALFRINWLLVVLPLAALISVLTIRWAFWTLVLPPKD